MISTLIKKILMTCIGLATALAVNAADKPASTKAENPAPYGLVFGKTTKEEALVILGKEGGKATESGYRVIKDDISNPDIEGQFMEGVGIEGVTTTRVWFYKGILMRLTYVLSGSFGPFNDQLTARYGKSARSQAGFGGEAHAAWTFKDIELSLDRPFMGDMTMDYAHGRLNREARESDARVYAEVTRAMGKKQKGF